MVHISESPPRMTSVIVWVDVLLRGQKESFGFWNILAGLVERSEKEVTGMKSVDRMRPEVGVGCPLEDRGYPGGHRVGHTV